MSERKLAHGLTSMFLAFAAAIGGANAPAAAPEAKPVWAIDYVTVKPGELDNYVAFLKANWLVNREEALRRKLIVSHKMVLTKAAKDGSKVPDIMLMTEYPSMASYADREKIFEPIRASRDQVKINGRTSRDFVASITEVVGESL